MKYNHLPIFQLSYKLMLELYRTTHLFPREYRYTLGQRIKDFSSALVDLIILTNSMVNKTSPIENSLSKVEQIRISLRLSCDLRILGFKHFESLARQLEEISNQLYKWLDWAEKQKK